MSEFDRTIINLMERPISNDVTGAETALDQSLRSFVDYQSRERPVQGAAFPSTSGSQCFGDSYRVTSTGGMGLSVQQGLAVIYAPSDVPMNINGVLGLDDLAVMKPVLTTAPIAFTVPAADPVHPRIDLIEITYNRQIKNPLSRDVLNPITGRFQPGIVDKLLSFNVDGQFSTGGAAAVNYKVGVPATNPFVPATDTAPNPYTAIAQIYVPANATSLDNGAINDCRRFYLPGGTGLIQAMVSVNLDTGDLSDFSCVTPPGVRVVACVYQDSNNNWGVNWYVWGGDQQAASDGYSSPQRPVLVSVSGDNSLAAGNGLPYVATVSSKVVFAGPGDIIQVGTGLPVIAPDKLGRNQFARVLFTVPFATTATLLTATAGWYPVVVDTPAGAEIFALTQNSTAVPSRQLIVTISTSIAQ